LIPRPDLPAGLLHRLAALDVALLEPLNDQVGVLDEAVTGIVHVEPEAVVLDPAQAPAEAQDHAPIGEVVQHRHLLRHPHGVVPRQHDHHRAQLDATGLRCDVGEELHGVGRHRVVGEVMFDRPHRVEAQRLCQQCHPDLLLPDLAVRQGVERVLEDRRVPDMHG
jgi:hypothetical protein